MNFIRLFKVLDTIFSTEFLLYCKGNRRCFITIQYQQKTEPLILKKIYLNFNTDDRILFVWLQSWQKTFTILDTKKAINQIFLSFLFVGTPLLTGFEAPKSWNARSENPRSNVFQLNIKVVDRWILRFNLNLPTFFAILEHPNALTNASELHKTCWSTDFQALKWWNVRSGGGKLMQSNISRPILSQICRFQIRPATFLNYIEFDHLLIVRLKNV